MLVQYPPWVQKASSGLVKGGGFDGERVNTFLPNKLSD